MRSCNVILDLTEDCMLRCSYCYINGGENQERMGSKTALNAVNKFVKSYQQGIVHLLFHGGESLLMFDRIQEIVSYLKVNNITNIKLYIQTNAIEVNEEIARYLYENNIKTCVSIDGFTHKSNPSRRAENEDVSTTTNRILKGMDYLINVGHQRSTICVLSKDDVDYIPQYLDASIERGVNLISMNPIVNFRRSTENEELILSNEEILQAYISTIYKINDLLKKECKNMKKRLFVLLSSFCYG